MFNIIDVRSGVRKDRPFSREEFARRQPAVVAGVATYLSTPEDAILSKLEWHAMSGSDTQRRDVIEMMVANAESLDLSYLHRWAEQLGVTNLFADLWATALSER